MTFSLWTIFALITAAVALYDGIVRVRGKRGNAVVAIIEIIAAVLLAVSLFNVLPGEWSTLVFSLVLEVGLVVILVLRGSGARRVSTVTIIALILNSVLALHLLGWLTLPFMGK